MRVRHLLGTLIFAIPLSMPAQAPTCVGRSTLVYADTVSFFLDAPPGWILDCNAGKDQGPLTVLYRVGESWRTGQAVMYAIVLTDRNARLSFSKRVDAEVAEWRRDVPDARVVAMLPIRTNDGTRASVRRFQSALPAFTRLVQSYAPEPRVKAP